MGDTGLTLDTLIDLLYDYRATLSGAAPIALCADGTDEAVPLGHLCARYLLSAGHSTPAWDALDPGASLRQAPLYQVTPLGDAALVGASARVGLVFYPAVVSVPPRVDAAWPDALETRPVPDADGDLGAAETSVRAVRALDAATIAAGPEAHAALVYLARATLAAVGEARAADMDAQDADDAREALCLAEDRMGDLERLLAEYRKRCGALVRLLKIRRLHERDRAPLPLPQSLVDQRRADDVDIERARLLDAWALRVITGGECCADAVPPPEWAALERPALDVSHG